MENANCATEIHANVILDIFTQSKKHEQCHKVKQKGNTSTNGVQNNLM